ncbi:hypothetical protein C8F04DRAFT_884486, partial [Mycena alexandri]
MASMARNYHNKLQKDRRETTPDIRDHTIEIVLQRTQRRVTEEQSEDLRKKLTREDIQKALKLSSNFRAPGLDGINYEVWNIIIDSRFQTNTKLEKPAFDIIKALLRTFNDIETNGIVKGTQFSE